MHKCFSNIKFVSFFGPLTSNSLSWWPVFLFVALIILVFSQNDTTCIMIRNRIRSVLDPMLQNNQNGFRPKRITVAQILPIRHISEEVKKNHLLAVLTFIDFKKAFDLIHSSKTMKILKAYMAFLQTYSVPMMAHIPTPEQR